jgi:2-dehydro-3-deoxygalactonokinase
MHWREGFIAVDWGTTNRRAYLIDRTGRCIDEMEDGRGVMSIPRGEFPSAVKEIRQRLGDWPLLLAGMAGSTRGWMDAPYLPCPIGLGELASSLVWAEPKRAAIIHGVCNIGDDRADIMRGEEVQILGAVEAGTIPADCTVCHPGTHNKWIEVRGGRIDKFRTVMTGEMFNLLKKGSILSEHLQGPVEVGEAFMSGVRRGLSAEVLTAELFSVRARALLGRLSKEDAAPFASGLLIGADVASAAGSLSGTQVFVMGSPKLTALYAAALRETGHEPRQVDGEEAFIAGAVRIAEMIE